MTYNCYKNCQTIYSLLTQCDAGRPTKSLKWLLAAGFQKLLGSSFLAGPSVQGEEGRSQKGNTPTNPQG